LFKAGAIGHVMGMSQHDTDAPPGGFPTEADLRVRYGVQESRFIDLAGQVLHVVDQGSGPAILLLHGSYACLRQWDSWAEGLAHAYRVVRFDWPAFGLSEPDGAGRYDADRRMDLIAALADRLGIDRFLMVATSSAGVAAAAFAAERDRLTGLILNNIAVGPLAHDETAQPETLRALIQQESGHPHWHSAAFWAEVLRANFADPARVTPALARRWSELNNRQFPGAVLPDPVATAEEFARTPGDLAKIAVPTLLLWSDRDPETPLEREGRRALALLAARDKALVVVPDCGHMMPDESGPAALALAKAFIDRVSVPV
jgi:pimeloyl-ACP methyl ester carboxylesterase